MGNITLSSATHCADPPFFSFYPQDVDQEYAANLSKISDLCHKSNVDCLFITQPTGYQEAASEQFKKGFWMTPPNQAYTLDFASMVHIASLYNNYLLRFSDENHLFVCDAATALAPTFENFYDDCHLNTNGAANMSIIVGKCIEGLRGHNKKKG